MAEAVKTALVTGAARRIGAAIAEDLAANGFAVAVHCNRSRDEGQALVEKIVASGGRAALLTADLTDMGQAGGLIAVAAEALGPVGLLVNNASVFEDDSVEDFDPDVWERHFAVHLKAPAILSRQLCRGTARQIAKA